MRRAGLELGLLALALEAVLCAAAGSAAAAEVYRYGVTRVNLGWSPPDTGIVDGYIVQVSRNGGPDKVESVVAQPSISLQASYGDVIVMRVRTLGRTDPAGPVKASAPSPPSPAIRFLPAPVWPAGGLLALHCAPCAALQLRARSNRIMVAQAPAYPAPWRLVGITTLDGRPGLDVLWQNDITGALTTSGLAADVVPPDASSSADLVGREAVAVTDMNDDGIDEILVRNRASATLEFWGVESHNIIHRSQISAPAAWHFAGAEDFDADGRADLWWQTDVPGRVEVWSADLSRVVDILARVDTPAAGTLVEVADFDGDGIMDALWRDTNGQLTITYLTPGGSGDLGALEDVVVLPRRLGDEFIEVRGSAWLDQRPGAEILVQHLGTYEVQAIFPVDKGTPGRAPLFDVEQPFELVYAE